MDDDLPASPQALAAVNAATGAAAPRSCDGDLFNASLRAGGGSQKLAVEIDDWRFDPGITEMTVPSGGATIIAVTNGRVSATIGGATKTYDTGDYWSVPGGATMTFSIQPPLRGAILRTIAGAPAT